MGFDRDYFTKSRVSIIGAGPIGLELGVALKLAGVPYTQFDAQQVGYTISWWPRNTYFFSTTERIEIAGVPAPSTNQQRLTGEEYLAYLRSIVEQFDLQINTYEPVTGIQLVEGGFELQTQPLTGMRRHFCEKLVLAIGDMHSPNRLEVPGEDLPNVDHYFTDPHRYFRKRLLIVGGRNSAAEAALRCWRAGARVCLSYRRPQFDSKSVKHWILPDLLAQIEAGTIEFFPGTLVHRISPGEVELVHCKPGTISPSDKHITVPADFVLLLTGFKADQTLFELAGVELEGPNRVPKHNPETMETNIPGLYVAGTAAAGSQSKYVLFIENSHVHVGRITKTLTGQWPTRLGTVAGRQYDLPFEEIQAN
jgi:thioredoxin reductase (NADPH)